MLRLQPKAWVEHHITEGLGAASKVVISDSHIDRDVFADVEIFSLLNEGKRASVHVKEYSDNITRAVVTPI